MILNIPDEFKKNNQVNIFMNNLINLFYSDTKYYGNPSEDGSYKVNVDGADLKTYRKESGVWVLKDTISG